ncbi:NEDD8 ultimate buster 1-like [Octopus vulgaris]|uniref:NEDD8 ultimate buster 1-like n=1 Tax=Octopus vulgaris TaxID=6645 RepID=A0AA36AMU3_OCTVU|nr:NEDD8 ultimate buster 1-like [Octopus vulgaris]
MPYKSYLPVISNSEIIEVNLQQTGLFLRSKIAEMCGVQTENIKMIVSGHLLSDELSLCDQNVKCNSLVLVIVSQFTPSEVHMMEGSMTNLANSRKEAEILSSKVEDSSDDTPFLEIADQNGRPLKLPASEKKALAFAMALNEKGRSHLKQKDYSSALILLLEADSEFKKCRSDILSAVDNFALVNLDIVWCYQQLQNIDELPDADKRLKICEDCFHQSYGANLERLTLMKGTSGKEQVLFMRLHLLQGVVAFHCNKLDLAKSLLKTASSELSQVTIKDEALQQVMSMGYKDREARLALRASGGDIQAAINHIEQRKEEKRKIRKEMESERKRKRIHYQLGSTENGEEISIENYSLLVEMGYPTTVALNTLRLANNDLNATLEMLQGTVETFQPANDTDVDPDLLAQIVDLGYITEFSKEALKSSKNDLEKALNLLNKYDGILPPNPASPLQSPQENTQEQDMKEKEVLDNFRKILPRDSEDYLDFLLIEESQILSDYLSLLEHV